MRSGLGGRRIVASNRALDGDTATAICEIFTEVVVAPGADEAARAVFAGKPNLRLLLVEDLLAARRGGLELKFIAGGLLAQMRDNGAITAEGLKVVTRLQPTERQLADMLFAWTVARHVKSNAIVFAKGGATAGIGGQMTPIRRGSPRCGRARPRSRRVPIRARRRRQASEPFPIRGRARLAIEAGVPRSSSPLARCATTSHRPGDEQGSRGVHGHAPLRH